MSSQPPEDDKASRPQGAPPESIIQINTERDLIRYRTQIVARLQADPTAMRLLVINPVQAMRDVGIQIAPRVANHILHSVQYPPTVRAQKTRLIHELTAALGRKPHPSNPEWLAYTVFVQLEIPAVQTTGITPAYQAAVEPAAVRGIQSLLPTRGVTVDGTPQDPEHPRYAPPTVPLACEPRTVEMLDLDAPVPPLPPAPAPASLSLTDLWFYKEASPVVRKLLRLGIIENSGVTLHGPSDYRRIRAGTMPNDLLLWLSEVRIPGRTTPRADQ